MDNINYDMIRKHIGDYLLRCVANGEFEAVESLSRSLGHLEQTQLVNETRQYAKDEVAMFPEGEFLDGN